MVEADSGDRASGMDVLPRNPDPPAAVVDVDVDDNDDVPAPPAPPAPNADDADDIGWLSGIEVGSAL